jgi:murein DD-endopeptidase MepM/ murein hydrolase activator NlpD
MNRIIAISLLFLMGLSLAPAIPALAQEQGPTYVVQSGDSCAYIAAEFGVSLDTLMQANGLTADCLLHPGDRLTVPGLEGITGTLTTTTVELGENFSTLSLRYGISQDALYRLNHVVNPERVMAGQTIVVTEPEEGSPGTTRYETGRVLSTSAGTPLVALAAAAGKNPWEMAALNGLSSMADQFSGQTFLVTGGEKPLRAWPEALGEVRFRTLPLVQGSTEEISLAVSTDAHAEGYLGDWKLRFRVAGGNLVALQGIYTEAAPGVYPFSVTATLADGGTVSFQQDVLLVKGDFGLDGYLTVPSETLDVNTIEAESAQTQQIMAPFTDTRYWEGLFQPPSSRDLSSHFGSIRSYNGGVYTTFHTGIDFYGREKETILAPAPGKVVFAGPLTICGNTTIIDHGWGVYTRYCHQYAFLVNVGDEVKTGQEIGQVGRTGRADGPHLHWEVWVGGVQVNPQQWLAEVFP